MSLLSTAERTNTANQIISWKDSCTASMNQAKSAFISIAKQRASMEINPEFTQEDKDEVDAILFELNTLAKTLIAPEALPIE